VPHSVPIGSWARYAPPRGCSIRTSSRCSIRATLTACCITWCHSSRARHCARASARQV